MDEHRIQADWMLVWSQKNATELDHPLGEPIPTGDINEIRVTEHEATMMSPQARVLIGYQLSDDPEDEGSWGTVIDLMSSPASADGTLHESTFTDVSTAMTKRHLRFVHRCYNNMGQSVEAARVRAIIDVR